jgi:hypothetical protein
MAGGFVGASGDYLGMMVDVAVVSARRVERLQHDASRCVALSICRHLIMRFRSTASHSRSYFDAESFDNSRTASCTVVINCAGKMMVEFFSTEISAIVWRVRS